MSKPIVKIAIESDESKVIDALKLAFAADPATRWVWPDPQKYLLYFDRFVKAFGGKAFAHKSAHYVENYSGAALWLPPNIHPDVDSLLALVQSSGSDDAKKYGHKVFEKMGSYYPKEPHWYLPLLGIDPLYHRKGLGSALMHYAQVSLDQDSVSVYLESSNPNNIPFYERHGFELLGRIQENSSPPIFLMVRKPRKN
jgi:ribosomal protein S18 acetylase RimI-like enzyme